MQEIDEPACELCAATPVGGLPASGGIFSNLFGTDGFPPRWECGTAWTSELGWLHIISDVAIFAAYFAIPVTLAFFIMRRKDAPFPPVMWLFVAFIGLCGLGHLIEATIFWTPWYRLSGVIKGLTAVVSWITVLALIRIVPKALHLPGLSKLNEELSHEVAARKLATESLEKRARQLEVINQEMTDVSRLTVGREERVISLKAEINELLTESGRPPRYDLDYSNAE